MQYMFPINEKAIFSALSGVIDKEYNVSVTNFIEKIVIQDKTILFTLEYDQIIDQTILNSKEQLRLQCINIVKGMQGVEEVKVAITSNKPQNSLTAKSKKLSLPNVKKIIVVASGKGGVGKSTIAANLAITMMDMGYKVGLLDADIYGPSLPKLFGITQKPVIENDQMVPLKKYGIQLMSVGFLVDPQEAVVWRGPMVSKTLHKLLRFTAWEDLDFLIVDTPPGTGDIHLTLAENYIIDGAVVITTPQQLAITDAQKGISMLNKLHVSVLGILENMSYYTEQNGNVSYIFGKGGGSALAKKHKVKFLGEIPLSQEISATSDSGKPLAYFGKNKNLNAIFNNIVNKLLDSQNI